ncbi:MAG: recombinase family protein [Allgaiera sp.]|jgi:site-specific DNA recombinase|nr:recombinase family protein [Allgaiera sp.]
MTDTPRVAIYARFSTDMQRQASLADQERLCRDLAAARGWKVVDFFSDAATSGASLMRPGLQALLRNAQAGQIDIILSEALDRLSRSQMDIAGLYQRLTFDGIRIVTASEGEISELHVGVTGTMNQLYLTELAKKTRRGLHGRVLAGKSAGGNSYGYEVVDHRDAQGDRIRGDRRINDAEAAVVERVFRDYASGISPRKIAETLNLEGIPGPRGGKWGASTIHGNKQRGTGILNNELYIGKLVWNRQRFVREPDTRKRVARPNPEAEWVIEEVPELRIVDDALWQVVKDRQEKTAIKGTGLGSWDRRRPRFLFSGLMVCGCCGGGFSTVGRDRFGCSAARNKGPAVCTSRATITRQDLEARVLHGLKDRLMEPELVTAFCEEYTAERNRLRAEAAGSRDRLEQELVRATRDHDKLVKAIIAGIPPEEVKEPMAALSARRKTLEAQLAAEPKDDPIRLHPAMADTYRTKIDALTAALSRPDEATEAKEKIRGLIDRIVLTPEAGGLQVDLEGALATILLLSLGKTKAASADAASQVMLVAGIGFEPMTFRL